MSYLARGWIFTLLSLICGAITGFVDRPFGAIFGCTSFAFFVIGFYFFGEESIARKLAKLFPYIPSTSLLNDYARHTSQEFSKEIMPLIDDAWSHPRYISKYKKVRDAVLKFSEKTFADGLISISKTSFSSEDDFQETFDSVYWFVVYETLAYSLLRIMNLEKKIRYKRKKQDFRVVTTSLVQALVQLNILSDDFNEVPDRIFASITKRRLKQLITLTNDIIKSPKKTRHHTPISIQCDPVDIDIHQYKPTDIDIHQYDPTDKSV